MKSLFAALLVAFFYAAGAQPVISVYAYSRVFTPGIIRERDIPAENGRQPVKQPLAVVQYDIYAAMKTVAGIRFRQVWIRGQWYKVARTIPRETPVPGETPASRVLVPAMAEKLAQIEPGDSLVTVKKPFPALASMMKKAELILCYSWKGKLYYKPAGRITALDRVTAE